MDNTENPALPEPISLALSNLNLDGATPDDIADRLLPLREAMIEASRECENFDVFDIFDAFPPLPANLVDAAEVAIDEAHEASITATPVLRHFARLSGPRKLQGLALLSFLAGRDGDDDWGHSIELEDALLDAFTFPEGKKLCGAFTAAQSFIRRNFYAGQAVRAAEQAKPDEEAQALAHAYAVVMRAELEKWETPDDPREAGHALEVIARKLARWLTVTPAEAVFAARTALVDTGWGEPERLAFDDAMQAAERAVAGRMGE